MSRFCYVREVGWIVELVTVDTHRRFAAWGKRTDESVRSRAMFKTRKQARAYAAELAKEGLDGGVPVRVEVVMMEAAPRRKALRK